MMAIVKRRDSPYKNGTFRSGTNWNDYILWCLIEMAKEVDRDEGGMIDAGTIVSNNGSAGVDEFWIMVVLLKLWILVSN